MNQLAINEKVGPNYKLLELTGDITAYTLSDLQEKMYQYILETNVVLDMAQVSSMDGSGVGSVLATINDGDENGTKLFIMNPSDSAHEALTRTGFWSSFHVIHAITEVSDS
ncbi:MAG: STAS domain-containing protein [Treponema sp.]|nr:STAS domain-containing protein [Treponema sp.]MCR5621346.1 STAS domain-containing protein [Treponema sp.]